MDELTLQPLDLVSIDDVTLRVESVEHEWSATTGYLRTLNCWLWQGYFGEGPDAVATPPPIVVTPTPDPTPSGDPVDATVGRTSIQLNINQRLIPPRTSYIIIYGPAGELPVTRSTSTGRITLSGLTPNTEYTISITYGVAARNERIVIRETTLP